MSDQQITGTDLDFLPPDDEDPQKLLKSLMTAAVKGGGFDQIMRERFDLQNYPNLEEVEATRDGFIIHDFLTEDAEIIDEDEEPIIDYSGKTQRELSILYRGHPSADWEGEDKWWRFTPAEQDQLIDGVWRSVTNFFGKNSPDAETVVNMFRDLIPGLPSAQMQDIIVAGTLNAAAQVAFAVGDFSDKQKNDFKEWMKNETERIKDVGDRPRGLGEQIHGKLVLKREWVDAAIFMSNVSVAALPVFKGLQLLGLGPRLASVISETIALGVAVDPDMPLIGELAKDAAKNEGFFQPMFEVLSILAINPDDPEIIKRAKHGAEGLLGALGGVAIIEAIIRSPQAKRGLVEWFKNRGGGGDGGVGEPGKMDFPPLSLNPDKKSVIPEVPLGTSSATVSEDAVFESVSGPIHMKLVSETNRALLNRLNALTLKEVMKDYSKMFPGNPGGRRLLDRLKKEGVTGERNIKRAMIKEMVEHKAPSSYSALENAVHQVTQKKASAKSWLGLITKSGKKADDIVKPDEIAWTGLDDWLKGHGNKTLTREEVLQYVRENTIVLREIESHTLHAPGKSKPDDLPSSRERVELDTGTGSFAPEWSPYKLKGEFENYREFLLIYPQGRNMGRGSYPLTAAERNEWGELSRRRSDMAGPFDAAAYTLEHANPRSKLSLPEMDRLKQLDAKYTKGAEGQSSHAFDVNNITSWIRTTERTVAGKRVMMIEEIQSDWSRHSPETLPNLKGWAAQAFRQMAVKAANEGFESISWTTGATQARLNKERMFIGSINFNENVLASSSSQHRAKLILDDASGREVTTVHIEAPRRTGEVTFEPVMSRGPDQSVEAARNAGLVETHIGKWKFRRNNSTDYEMDDHVSSWQGKTVEQVIGKEAANRLDVSYRKGDFGNNLTPDGTANSKYGGWLGGEGKQVIYDQMLVKAAKKLAAKFETTVSKTGLDTGPLEISFDQMGENAMDFFQVAWRKALSNADDSMAEKLHIAMEKLEAGLRPRNVLAGLTRAEVLEYLPETIASGGVEKVWTLNLNQKMRQSLMKKGAPVWAIGAGTMIGGAEDKQDGR